MVIAQRLDYLTMPEIEQVEVTMTEVAKMLHCLIRKLV